MVVKFKIWPREQVFDVGHIARQQVVHANNMEAFGQKPVAEVRTDEPGGAGDEDSFFQGGNVFKGTGGRSTISFPNHPKNLTKTVFFNNKEKIIFTVPKAWS
jgi:hypothetical protein